MRKTIYNRGLFTTAGYTKQQGVRLYRYLPRLLPVDGIHALPVAVLLPALPERLHLAHALPPVPRIRMAQLQGHVLRVAPGVRNTRVPGVRVAFFLEGRELLPRLRCVVGVRGGFCVCVCVWCGHGE